MLFGGEPQSLDVVDDAICLFGLGDGVDMREVTRYAEVKIGRNVVFRRRCIFEIETGADVLQCEPFIIDILYIPLGSILDVLTVLVVEAEDEAAPSVSGL